MQATAISPTIQTGWTPLREFARLLLLAVVLPVLVITGLILWRATVVVGEQATARLTAAAESNGREINSFLQTHLVAMQLLAERRNIAGDIDDLPTWQADLDRVQRYYPAFTSLLVTDRDGRVLLSQPTAAGAAPQPLSVADRDYFREPKRSGRAHVSDAFSDRAPGRDPVLAVSAPLLADGRFAGVIAGSIRIDVLAQRSRWLQTRGFELLLLDRNQSVVLASNGLPYRALDRLRDSGRDRALLAVPRSGSRARMQQLQGALRDGGDAYVLAVPLQVGWRLLLLLPERSVEAGLRRNVLIMLGLLAVVLFGVLAIVGMKLRQLDRSVRGLLERMQHFALDRASVMAVPEGMPHELVPLAEAMNQLAARARAAYDEVSLSLQEQSRLREELQAVAQRLLTVQEDERRTLSRELHDDIGQAITAIKLGATSLGDDSQTDDDAGRREILDEIVSIADQTVTKLRNLSLLLRPPQLDSLGLEAALRGQVAALARNSRTKITLHIAPLPERPSPALELACFRIVQEALTNAVRHSGANEINVTLEACGDMLLLQVGDDGRGFEPGQARGLGLLTMRERAQQLGGSLTIDTSPDHGTRLRAKLPMHSMA